MRLSQKLLLILLLVSLIPLLIAGAIAKRTITDYQHNYSTPRLQSNIAGTAEIFASYFLISARDFRTLSEGMVFAAENGAARTTLLRRYYANNTHFTRLRFVDINGTVMASTQADEIGQVMDPNTEDLKLVRQALSGPRGKVFYGDFSEIAKQMMERRKAGLTTPMIRDQSIHPTDLTMTTVVTNQQGKPVGALVGSLTTRYPYLYFDAFLVSTGEDGIFLLDKYNRVLMSYSKQNTAPGTMLEPKYIELLRQVPADPKRKAAAKVFFNGVAYYVANAPVPNWPGTPSADWSVVVLMPQHVVLGGLDDSLRKAAIPLLALLVAIVLIALLFSYSIARPIIRLARSAELVASGNYATRVHDSSTAEVRHLANSFNLMAEAVATKETSLEAQITERKLAQEHLHQLKVRQELILNGAADGLLGLDASGKITFINPAGAKILGGWAEDFAGMKICNLVECSGGSDASGPCPNCLMSNEVGNSDGQPHEGIFIGADDLRIPVEYVVSKLLNEASAALGAVIVFRDVAQRKEHERELNQAREAAEVASRTKSAFLANMSHEIRTPMNGVLGFTNLLLDTKLDGEQREHVETIRNSGEALLQVINDILDFSKVEAGKMTVEKMPFDLPRAVEEVGNLLSPQAELKGIEVVLKIAEDVPSNLEGDPGRVRQILLNLVSNAIKFTKRGHVLIEVAVLPADQPGEHGMVRCTVTDTGIGIAEDKQALMFKEFSQADVSTTREFGGTGLGLVISKRLIELMGGHIGFSSEAGKGSCFWFTLPAPQNPVLVAMPTTPPNIAEFNVLVVDDHEINRRLLSLQLQGWGITHRCANSGADALAAMRAARNKGKPFNIAILDFLMPEMDGLELGIRIKEDPNLKSTAMIMLTSGSRRSEAPTFFAAGFCEFLLKPIARPHQLFNSLIKAWHSHTGQSANFDSNASAQIHVASPRVNATRMITSELVTPLRVLVAEDNAINQRLVKHMLEKLNCRVDLAFNGREAIAMSHKLQYDIIFMDCLMPEIDGYEATVEIRKQESETSCHVPIIALTANAILDARDKCIAAGMDDYLSKPVYIANIKEMLEKWAQAKPHTTTDIKSVTQSQVG